LVRLAHDVRREDVVGSGVGCKDTVGSGVRIGVGFGVGDAVGNGVGSSVGTGVGNAVGEAVIVGTVVVVGAGVGLVKQALAPSKDQKSEGHGRHSMEPAVSEYEPAVPGTHLARRRGVRWKDKVKRCDYQHQNEEKVIGS